MTADILLGICLLVFAFLLLRIGNALEDIASLLGHYDLPSTERKTKP